MKKYLLLALLLVPLKILAARETIPKGSFIMNLGIAPQTIQNGLKPYGLVYTLLQDFNVPVKWVINPSKTRDAVDFSYNNTSYRSGSFVVLAKYRTAEVNQLITEWQANGVVGESIQNELTLDVFATLNYAPRWTIDKSTGLLVTPFFVNANIPASAHGGSDQSAWKNPSELTECDDLFILPHADPIWSTHQNLLSWNKDFKGAIWSGCHAVSVMENIVSPDGTEKMNFLTSTGMVDYTSHVNGDPPFNYLYPADPIMQFIGKMDDAALSGSEATYLPKIGGGWRPGVKLSIIDPSNFQVPAISPGPAALLAYGYGFDDSKRGLIMYQAGHFHNGISIGGESDPSFKTDHIALQRAFFNFSFLAIVDRQARNVSAQITSASTMRAGVSYPVNFTIPAGINLSDYEIRWSASAGTISTGSDPQTITYTSPADSEIKIVLLTLFLKDACGREFFTTQTIRTFTGDGEIVSSRLVSANQDGQGNDFLYLKNIEIYPDNEIQIFNRWGLLVYAIKGYDNSINAFKGFSNQGGKAKDVIDGVYYYVLKYKDETNEEQQLKDYFILKR